MTARVEVFGRFSGRMPDTTRLLAVLALGAVALEQIVGTLAALGFLASGMMFLALKPRDAVLDLADFRYLLVVPAFCALSMLWSDVPSATLRAGIQLMATFVIAILMARRLPPSHFLVALVFVLGCVVALSVTTGTYRSDTGALIGYFASKNAMGAASAILAVLATGLIGLRGGPAGMRGAAALAALLGIGGVVLAQSMGALAAMALGLSAYPALWVLRRIGLHLQVAATAGFVLLLALSVVLFIANIDAVAALLLDLTGKDITLTGRTVLWGVALDQIAARPLLGGGYQAFWVHGNPVAEDMWRMFGIESRSGFHFHNLFLSNAVETGILGVALQVVLLARLSWLALVVALRTRDYRSTTFLAVTVMSVAVTPLEVPAFFPFNLQTLIVVVSFVYLRDAAAALAASDSEDIIGRR